jgi:thiol-disulfide isomerase/thioredoxin
VPIQVHIDMRAWRGNGAAGILVRFKDERHPPVAYKVTFYRPAPLQPNPTTVEFGIDDGTGRSTRTFRLLWAAEAKRAGIKILAGIRSEKGAVDCRLVSQREQVKRLVNAEQDSRYQEFEFEVRLLAGQHPGRGEDSIIVPVMIDGLKSAMVVPVHYTTRGQLFSSPDGWVGVVPEGPCAIDLHLYRADGQPAPSELSVSCTDEAVELAYHALSQVHGPELGVIHATLKSRPSDKGRLDATIAIGAQVGKDSVRLEIPVTLILAPRPPAESSHDKDMAEFDAAEVQASAASAAAAPLPWSQDSDAANERERLVSEINDAGIPIRDFMAVLKDPPSQWEPRASKAIPALRRAMADIDRLGQLDPRLAARMANIHDASLVCLLALHDPVGISRAEAMKNGGENDQVISAAAKLIARAVTGSHEAKDQSVFIKQLIKLDYAHATSDRLAGLTVMLYEYAATPELASDLKGALKSMQGRIPTEIRNAEVAGDRLRSLVGSRLVIAGTTTDGKAFEIGAMRGRVVLIDFWASWCAPCRAEIPTIQNLYRRYHSKGLEVVGISNDYDPAELKNFVTRNRIPWPQLFDPKAAADGQWHPITVSLGIEGIPRVLLIGKQGRLEAIDLGDHGDAVIEKLLAE